MKKNHLNSILSLAALMIAVNVNAQIDNLTNVSPEWLRTGARNAATDGTDIMAYNPGGVSMLKPGFHINIGNQSFFRKPSHEYDLGMGAQQYKQDGNDMVVPNLYISYNKNKWAVAGGVYIAGGGATVNYPHGSISTDLLAFGTIPAFDMAYGTDYSMAVNSHLKGSSYYIASLAGGSYSVNDKLSFGLFVRHLTAKNKMDGGFTLSGSSNEFPDVPLSLSTEANASGTGVMAGIDVKPSSKLNLAVRYESQVSLDFKTKVVHDDFGLFVDGDKSHRDFPAVFGFGADISVTDKFKVLTDFNYYFQKQADWGLTNPTGIPEEAMETSELAGDASFYSLAFEYDATSKLSVSLGGTYSKFNYKDQSLYYTNLGSYEVVSDNNGTLNMGAAYKVTERVKFNAGFVKAIYSKDKNVASPLLGTDVKVNNSITSVGVGVDLLF